MHRGGALRDLTCKELADRLSCAVDWPRRFVGIRFLFTEEDYQAAGAPAPVHPIRFCEMVCLATHGRATKSTADVHKCPASIVALGLRAPDGFHRSGRRAFSNCLYHDMGTAKYSRDRQSICDHETYGVLLKPLDDYADDEQPPQIIQVVTSPYYAMRIIQGYTYYYGVKDSFKMSGLQAVCAESTAYPYMSNDINLSMFCGGTRMFCDWSEGEVDVSIPYGKLHNVVEGTLRTMNLEDSDKKKAGERQKLAALGLAEDYPLQDGFNYCKLTRGLNGKR